MSKEKNRLYIAIDLKSFYASVECVERGLNPLTTHLVVADESRTTKTICLAVSPSLKQCGVSGRPRLFEVNQKVRECNASRKWKASCDKWNGSSSDAVTLQHNPAMKMEFIVAPPRMACYIDYSTKIYQIYLKYVAPDDIHVYSIDEVFMDVTSYLATYRKEPEQLAQIIIDEILKVTGITATAGIGTNLYLAKVAMDIVAKHMPPNTRGARIAMLNERTYRKTLWQHQPLTDFWRIGKGTAKKLEQQGLYTMGDIARCSIGLPNNYYNEDLLYRMLGVNAELLIDHAWGWEPCTILDIKSYRPATNSLSSGQVLHRPYTFAQAKVVLKEMADALALDLVDKSLVTNQLTLSVGYDRKNLEQEEQSYGRTTVIDSYGRLLPKPAHGTITLTEYTSSSKELIEAAVRLYNQIVDASLFIRRITISANHVIAEKSISTYAYYKQLNLFDMSASSNVLSAKNEQRHKEKQMQRVMLAIRKKYGKNAVIKGMNLVDGATGMERNNQIGGHRA